MPTKSQKKTKKDGQPAPPQHLEGYERALENFTQGVELVHKGEYAEALKHLEGLDEIRSHEPELAARARVYVSVCKKKMAPEPEPATTPEQQYELAVLRANDGRHDEALGLIDQAITADPGSPAYLYARASVYALQGQAEQAVADLRKAVAIDPQIRFQATNDPDFEKIRDDAAFIDVIEPTTTGV